MLRIRYSWKTVLKMRATEAGLFVGDRSIGHSSEHFTTRRKLFPWWEVCYGRWNTPKSCWCLLESLVLSRLYQRLWRGWETHLKEHLMQMFPAHRQSFPSDQRGCAWNTICSASLLNPRRCISSWCTTAPETCSITWDRICGHHRPRTSHSDRSYCTYWIVCMDKTLLYPG